MPHANADAAISTINENAKQSIHLKGHSAQLVLDLLQ